MISTNLPFKRKDWRRRVGSSDHMMKLTGNGERACGNALSAAILPKVCEKGSTSMLITVPLCIAIALPRDFTGSADGWIK